MRGKRSTAGSGTLLRHGAPRRGGFTLVEVMVVVVVAGLIGLGVAGTVSVALDTRQRVAERGVEVRSALAWRGLVIDALRNARPPAVAGDTALLLTDATAPDGRPADRLTLLTSGSLPPLYAGTDWVVSLETVGDRVRLMAAPVGVRSIPVEVWAPAGITGLDAAVLTRAPGQEERWWGEWSESSRLPRAVRISFAGRDGTATLPVTVHLPERTALP